LPTARWPVTSQGSDRHVSLILDRVYRTAAAGWRAMSTLTQVTGGPAGSWTVAGHPATRRGALNPIQFQPRPRPANLGVQVRCHGLGITESQHPARTDASLPTINCGQRVQMRRHLRAYLPVRAAVGGGLASRVLRRNRCAECKSPPDSPARVSGSSPTADVGVTLWRAIWERASMVGMTTVRVHRVGRRGRTARPPRPMVRDLAA